MNENVILNYGRASSITGIQNREAVEIRKLNPS